MKIRLPQIITPAYFFLFAILLKTYSIFSIIFLVIVLFLDYFTNIRTGIKNLLYFLAALSISLPLFSIFLLYLPFAVFGALLESKSFTRNYIFGFAVSFIPTLLIYLVSTYLNLQLNLAAISLIYYLLPAVAILLLIKRRNDTIFFDIDSREFFIIMIILFFTIFISFNIISNTDLFMANGVKVFSRLQIAIRGLNDYAKIPIYDPAMAQGEPTYLWDAPLFHTHLALANFILSYIPGILFFNSYSLYILLLATLALSVLFFSVLGKKQSTATMLAIASISVTIGLNFYFLQQLESIKQFVAFPIAYIFLSMLLDNPSKIKDFAALLYLSVLLLTIHIPYGAGALVLAASIYLIKILFDLKDRNELGFLKLILSNKLKIFIILMIIIFIPLFYIAPSFIYKDFFLETEPSKLSYQAIKLEVVGFFKGLVGSDFKMLSIRYPDVSRIDDHKFGFFVSVFGVMSLFVLLVMYKIKEIQNYRLLALGFILNLIILSLITSRLSIRIGGFYRTVPPYLLILMGASILTFIFIFNKKLINLILTGIVFIAFMHAIPYAKQNITNIHQEKFASGEIYKSEIEFAKQLPVDGRIMTYGLFSNAVEYGMSRLTERYFSRNERIELAIDRNIFPKIHGQHSFGEPTVILTKNGQELSNYLIMGGYKYLFMNIQHPIGNYVLFQIYPNYSYPIYQNGPFVFLITNKSNYAEKVDLVKSLPEDIYRQKDGHRFITVSDNYNFDIDSLKFADNPREPEPIPFERISPTRVKISGSFNDNEYVVFKELYFSRWKASMNGKEIPVMANNHDLILIKTIKGSEILLDYSVAKKEKIFGMLSLAGLLGLSIVLLILLIKE